MKLTEDDFSIHKCNEKEWYYFISQKNPQEVIEQILENQEKARKWEETLAHGLFETGHVTLNDYTSALKLRELIEKRIEFFKNAEDFWKGVPNQWWIDELQELLKDSKKQ